MIKLKKIILRKFIFKKQDYNKRYTNFIDKKQLNFLNLFLNFIQNICIIIIIINYILSKLNLYAIKPSNNHIIILNKIINRIRLKIELIHNLNLKLDYYVFTKNRKIFRLSLF